MDTKIGWNLCWYTGWNWELFLLQTSLHSCSNMVFDLIKQSKHDEVTWPWKRRCLFERYKLVTFFRPRAKRSIDITNLTSKKWLQWWHVFHIKQYYVRLYAYQHRLRPFLHVQEKWYGDFCSRRSGNFSHPWTTRNQSPV